MPMPVSSTPTVMLATLAVVSDEMSSLYVILNVTFPFAGVNFAAFER